MDVTPQVINEVEFHQKMRGYDPDEVDDFLERVAVAVGQLQDKVRDAGDRAAVADRRATELETRIRELTDDNHHLRDQIARLHGQLRTARLGGPVADSVHDTAVWSAAQDADRRCVRYGRSEVEPRIGPAVEGD